MPEAQLVLRKIDDEIAPAIARINAIRHYQPKRTLKQADSIVPEVEKLIASHMEALQPWKQEGKSWSAAEHRARTKVSLEACDAVLVVDKHTGGDSKSYTLFELVKTRDLDGFKDKTNPYDSVLKMHELGLSSSDFRKVDGEEKFVVDFPLLKYGRGQRWLGCYAQGDGNIKYVHGYTNRGDHPSLMPVNFVPRKIARLPAGSFE